MASFTKCNLLVKFSRLGEPELYEVLPIIYDILPPSLSVLQGPTSTLGKHNLVGQCSLLPPVMSCAALRNPSTSRLPQLPCCRLVTLVLQAGRAPAASRLPQLPCSPMPLAGGVEAMRGGNTRVASLQHQGGKLATPGWLACNTMTAASRASAAPPSLHCPPSATCLPCREPVRTEHSRPRPASTLYY